MRVRWTSTTPATRPRAALRLGVTPDAFLACVTDTDTRTETYHRALHVIERRTIALRTTPALDDRRRDHRPSLTSASAPREPELRRLPDPALVDPWAPGLEQIETASRVRAVCPRCTGSALVACASCRGSSRVQCGVCRGSGRVAGQRKMKNCPRCRGRGADACPDCRGGQVGCGTCATTGRVTAWLTVERATTECVVVHPRNASASVHPRLDDPRDFDTPPQRFRAELLRDARLDPLHEELPAVLHPPRPGTSERVVSGRVQTFASVVRSVSYATALGRGHVEVVGRPGVVSTASDWRPLRRRATALFVLGMLGLVATSWLVGSHWLAHPWFARYGHGGSVALLGVAAAFASSLALGQLLVRRQARNTPTLGGTLLTAGAFLLASWLGYRADVPTATSARAALAAGDLERATSEGSALRDLGLDPSAGDEILDAVRLQQVPEGRGIDAMIAWAQSDWHQPSARAFALGRARTAVDAERERATAAADYDGLDRISLATAWLDPAGAAAMHRSAALGRLDACVVIGDVDCLSRAFAGAIAADVSADELRAPRERAGAWLAALLTQSMSQAHGEVDPSVRVQILTQAMEVGRVYVAVTGQPSDPSAEQIGREFAAATAQLMPRSAGRIGKRHGR